jgi:hypothetical protein
MPYLLQKTFTENNTPKTEIIGLFRHKKNATTKQTELQNNNQMGNVYDIIDVKCTDITAKTDKPKTKKVNRIEQIKSMIMKISNNGTNHDEIFDTYHKIRDTLGLPKINV